MYEYNASIIPTGLSQYRGVSINIKYVLSFPRSMFNRTHAHLKKDWMVRGLNRGKGKHFSLLLDIKTGSGTHPTSYSIGTWVISRG
jgi:hypothetical protein